MDLKQIKEIITLMERAGIKKFSIKQKSGEELHLERHEEHPPHHHGVHPPVAVFHPPAHHTSHPVREEPVAGEDKPGQFITAPLVGTFYTATSPDEPPLVKVGDRVNENTVMCIIEAMKVMNEVKAGKSGTVAEVLVDNAHPVEFGTKLFRIV